MFWKLSSALAAARTLALNGLFPAVVAGVVSAPALAEPLPGWFQAAGIYEGGLTSVSSALVITDDAGNPQSFFLDEGTSNLAVGKLVLQVTPTCQIQLQMRGDWPELAVPVLTGASFLAITGNNNWQISPGAKNIYIGGVDESGVPGSIGPYENLDFSLGNSLEQMAPGWEERTGSLGISRSLSACGVDVAASAIEVDWGGDHVLGSKPVGFSVDFSRASVTDPSDSLLIDRQVSFIFGQPSAAAEDIAPEVTGVSVKGDAVTFGTDDTILFTVTMSEGVKITGPTAGITLPFLIGTEEFAASYVGVYNNGGTPTTVEAGDATEFEFSYQVTKTTAEGVLSLPDASASITLPGDTTITDEGGNSLVARSDVTQLTGVNVDKAPYVTAVTADEGVYGAGDKIEFTLTMSEVVSVVSPDNVPVTFPFTINDVDASATYESGDDTNALVFTYTVTADTPSGTVSIDKTAALSIPDGASITGEDVEADTVLADLAGVTISGLSVDTSSTSVDENVPAGSVTVTVVEQPIAGASGAVFPQQPVVQLVDGDGNPVSSGGSVSASLAGDVSQDKLTGTKTIDVQDDGFARFSDLGISGAEADDEFQLVFASSIDGVAAIVSEVFTVAGTVSVPESPNEPGTRLEGPAEGAAVAGRGSAPVTLTLRDAAGRRTGTNEGVAAVTFSIVDGPADAYLQINPSGTSVTVPSSNSASGEFTVSVVSSALGAVSVAAAIETSSGETLPLPGTLDVVFTSADEAVRRFQIVRQPVAAGDGEKLAVQPILHVLNADGSLDTTDDTTVVRVDPVALTAGVAGSLNASPSGATATAENGVVTFDDLTLNGELGEGYALSFRDETLDRDAGEKAATIQSDTIYLAGVLEVIRDELSTLLYDDLRETVEEQQDRFDSIASGALGRLQAGQDMDMLCGDVEAQDVSGYAKADTLGFLGDGSWGGHTYDCTTDTHIINSGELALGFTRDDRLTFDFSVMRQQERFVEEDRLLGLFWGGYAKRDVLGSSTASGIIDGVGINGGAYGALQLEDEAYLDFYAAGALGYHRFDLTFQRFGMRDIAADGNYQYAALFAGAALSGEFAFEGFDLRPRSGVEFAYARSSNADVDVLGGIQSGRVDIPDYRGLRLYATPSFEFTHRLQDKDLNEVMLNTAVSPSLSCRRYSRHGASDCDPSLRIEFSRHDTQSQAQLGLDMEYVFEDQKDTWSVELNVWQKMLHNAAELSFGIGRTSNLTSSLRFSIGANF